MEAEVTDRGGNDVAIPSCEKASVVLVLAYEDVSIDRDAADAQQRCDAARDTKTRHQTADPAASVDAK